MIQFLFYRRRSVSDFAIDDGEETLSRSTLQEWAGATHKKEIKPAKKDLKKNKVREIRESLLMSKAELARKAGLSVLTVGRVEDGIECRMDTKRKIILALGFTLTDKGKIFPD